METGEQWPLESGTVSSWGLLCFSVVLLAFQTPEYLWGEWSATDSCHPPATEHPLGWRHWSGRPVYTQEPQPAPRPGRAQLVRWWAQSRAQGKDKGRVGSEGEWAPGNALTGQASNKHRRGAWGGGARTAAGLPLRTCRPGLASMQLVAPWAPKKMPGAG